MSVVAIVPAGAESRPSFRQRRVRNWSWIRHGNLRVELTADKRPLNPPD